MISSGLFKILEKKRMVCNPLHFFRWRMPKKKMQIIVAIFPKILNKVAETHRKKSMWVNCLRNCPFFPDVALQSIEFSRDIKQRFRPDCLFFHTCAKNESFFIVSEKFKKLFFFCLTFFKKRQVFSNV